MKKHVWIVDDNADSRILARAILAGEYAIDEIGSGDEVLIRLEDDSPDLLLVDISMPGLSGYEVLTAIRAHPRLANVPIIAYTAQASSPERRGLVAFGFDACVTKPILDERDLLHPIAELLTRPRARRIA